MAAQAQQDQSQQTSANQSAQQLQVATPTTKPKSNAFLIITLVLLFILMAAGIGYLGYQNYQLRREISNLQAEESTPETSDVSQWRTYTNDVYGYKLEYPPDWTLDTSSSQTAFIEIDGPEYLDTGGERAVLSEPLDPETFARISISDTGETGQVESVASGWRSGQVETITLDGRNAAKVVKQPNTEGEVLVEGGTYSVSVFVKDDTDRVLLIQLETANLSMYEPVFNKVLSSFEFTNADIGELPEPDLDIDTTSWTVFENNIVRFKTNTPNLVAEGSYEGRGGGFTTVNTAETLNSSNLPISGEGCKLESDPYCLLPAGSWNQNNAVQKYLIDNAVFNSYYLADNVNNRFDTLFTAKRQKSKYPLLLTGQV